MDEPIVDKYYKRQAKDLTNMLFDKGFLNDNLARKSIDWLENYIGYLIQSHCQTATKVALLMAKKREKVV